jgi:hypothetical protein
MAQQGGRVLLWVPSWGRPAGLPPIWHLTVPAVGHEGLPYTTERPAPRAERDKPMPSTTAWPSLPVPARWEPFHPAAQYDAAHPERQAKW